MPHSYQVLILKDTVECWMTDILNHYKINNYNLIPAEGSIQKNRTVFILTGLCPHK